MKILIADDDRANNRLLEKRLAKWGYEVASCTDGEQAWEILQKEDAPRLAILGWETPKMSGIQLCRKIRQKEDGPYIYVILATGKSKKEDLVKGMDAGADDYVIKPFDMEELKVRLRAGRRVQDLQAALLSVQEVLRAQATHDPLTGLWNRSVILEIVGRHLARVQHNGGNLVLMMLDLDHFKMINDTHGHLAGDAVLRETCRRMSSVVRPNDAVGRYGGEEFLVVLPGCVPAGALTVAERIRTTISEIPMNTSEGVIPVTASVGVAIYGSGPWEDMESLTAAADAALYRAKHSGRNRVELAFPEIRS
jgi:two-component system cell cycle response regulator